MTRGASSGMQYPAVQKHSALHVRAAISVFPTWHPLSRSLP